MFHLLAESFTTAQGVWVLTGFGAITVLAIGVNQVMGILVKRKQLNAPIISQTQINPQPLIVAMEKEFLLKRDYDRDCEDAKNQLTEVRSYAHGRIHDLAQTISSISLSLQGRSERLAALEADSKTHGRQLGAIDQKIDRLIDAAGALRGKTGAT